MNFASLIFVLTGLTAGNFAYQAIGAGHYGEAIERSYFQAVALVVVYIYMRVSA